MTHSKHPLRIVLIGPECTGKTWLAGELAIHYEVPWSPEYAREYAESKSGLLSYEDVDAIGRGQKAAEDAVFTQAAKLGVPLVVLDTDLVSTIVYSRHYYGDCPEWIESDASERVSDLYLLHHVDVEWKADGNQREQPERREELFDRFVTTLQDLSAEVADVVGPWEVRKRRAIESVGYLLAENQ